MTAENLPSPEFLRKLLRYDAETGKLYWRERTPDMFIGGEHSAEHICNRWNSRFADKEAFTASDNNGYKLGRISGRNYKAHRVIWAIFYGEWPNEQIDHISGVRDDNRISELRAVTHAENNKNQKRRSDNTSGVVGVDWCKGDRKWRARIRMSGKVKHIGYFVDFSEAVAARKAAEVEYNFHPNHGRD